MTFSDEPRNYLRGVQNDLDQFGMLRDARAITDISELAGALSPPVARAVSINPKKFAAASAVGELLQRVAPVILNPKEVSVGVCAEAEPRFFVNAATADDPCLNSPLILIRGDKPIGVAKAFGAPTIYSFGNSRNGFVEDMIGYSRQIGLGVKELPARAGAYLLDLADVDDSQLFAFEPLRVSVLVVPGEVRESLLDCYDCWGEPSYYMSDEPPGGVSAASDISTGAINLGSSALSDACESLMNSPDARAVRLTGCGGVEPYVPERCRTVIV